MYVHITNSKILWKHIMFHLQINIHCFHIKNFTFTRKEKAHQ